MTPDELLEWATEHPDYDRWRKFYHDAWVHACDIAAGTPFTASHVAKAIAALSPNKGWTQNLALARGAVALAVEAIEYQIVGADLVFAELGAMGSRKQAAYEALFAGRIPNGPKVSAFARNIMGDLSYVTVDRHMKDIFADEDKPDEACIDYCETRGRRYGLWPAEVQAVLWGAWRATKGYQTY